MGFRRGQRQGRPTGGDIRMGYDDGSRFNPDPFYNPGLAPFFPRYPGAELPNQGGRGGSELDWLPQPPRMPWDRFPSPRPPFPPPFRPPQRSQMPAFGWISPTGVTPEYRSWMPGMSFAAERSYRNPAQPFPIPSPIMPPGYTPPVTPPGYTPPGYTPPSLPPGFPIGPIDGIGGGGGGGWAPGITKAGGGRISSLAQGMATGMAIGGRTGYQRAGEVPDDYLGTNPPNDIRDYYGIGGGGLAIPPQPGMRSYGALPSPEGYRPGFDAEWNYFPYSNVPVSAYGQTGQTPYTGNVMGGIGGLAGQGWSGVPYSAYESLFSLPEGYEFPPIEGGVQEDVTPPYTDDETPIYYPTDPAIPPGAPPGTPPIVTPPIETPPGITPPGVIPPGGYSPFDPSDYDWSDIFSAYGGGQGPQGPQGPQGLGSLFDPTGYDWSDIFSAYGPQQEVYETPETFDPSDYDWSNIFDQFGGGVGPQGPQGPQGLQGLQGLLGLQGLPGEQGGAFNPTNYDWSNIFDQYSLPFEASDMPYQSTNDIANIAYNAAMGIPGYMPSDRDVYGSRQGIPIPMAKGGRTPYQAFGEIMTEQETVTAPPAQTEVIEETAEVTSEGDEQLIQMAVLAIQGKHPSPDDVQKAFIERFGLDAWIAFRERVLQTAAQNPEATTEGMIQGEGTGMSDEIPGVVAGQEKIAVSPGEFIVPADVVSGIGDGSSDAGSASLYEMMDRVRQGRTGTTEQPRPLNKGGILPA